MKYLNSIYDLLLEEVQSYQWELVSDSDRKVKYTFDDANGNSYLVEIKNLPGNRGNDISTSWELVYFVVDEDQYTRFFSVSKVVNVNPYRTLQTVFGDILRDFIKRKSWTKTIMIHGLAKDREREYISQRTKMYVRFLERNPIPGYKLTQYGNRINLTKI